MFDVALDAPTEGQTISIPPTGQSGPDVLGSVVIRFKWTCSTPPPAMFATWKLFFNGTMLKSDNMSIEFGSDGEGSAEATPTITPTYTSSDAGGNTYRLAVTLDQEFRDAVIGFTINVVTPSSSSQAPSSSSQPPSSSSSLPPSSSSSLPSSSSSSSPSP